MPSGEGPTGTNRTNGATAGVDALDDTDAETADVVVVGGGPAGASAAIFTARYGLDTVVFDRGAGSLPRCAHLENYLGFPAGVGIETFHDLAYDHVETAGARLYEELVESVTRAPTHGYTADDAARAGPFVVETQGGRRVVADRVVAASSYDGEYLRPLGGDAMFEMHAHHGHEHERFRRDYAERDGSTPIDGLYVAAPSAAADRQAIVAAGRGARVGIAVVEAVRRARGYPEAAADWYDWTRREGELDGEWGDRDRWRQWFENLLPEDHGLPDERRVDLREREIDRLLGMYLSADERVERNRDAQRRLLEHVDDDLLREAAADLEDAERMEQSTET